MSTPQFDLSAVVQAVRDRDLEMLASMEGLLGVRLDGPACDALLANMEDPAGEQPYSRRGFPLDKALLVIVEAARGPLGLAVWEHNLYTGRQLAVAYCTDGTVCFSAGVLPNTRNRIGDIWRELSPWYNDLPKNRKRLAIWSERGELVRFSRVELSDVEGVSEEVARAAFVTKIVDNPDDCGLRLVFADWLLERNDVQGTMIQLGQRLQDARAAGDYEAAKRLRAEDKALVAEQGARIAGDVARLADSYTVDAGFVRAIRMKANTFATHGDRLLQEHPIQALTVSSMTDKGLKRLPGAKGLRRLRHLLLEQDYGRERPVDLGPLCDSEHLGFLQQLTLDNCPLGGEGGAAFRRLHAPSLRKVELSMFSDAHQIVEGLADNPVVKLETLRLTRFRDDPPWSEALTGAAFASLTSLDLSGVDAAGTSCLLKGVRLLHLRSVHLQHPAELDAPQLETFRFDHGAQPTAEAIGAAVARYPTLKHLEVMGLKAVDREGREQLVDHLLALPEDHPLETVLLYRLDADLSERLKGRYARR